MEQVNTADAIFIAASIGLIGALLLSRAAIFKRMDLIRKETSTFLGFNPFALKGAIQQWQDARIGMFLYVLGVMLSLLAGVASLHKTSSKSIIFESYITLSISIILSIVLYRIMAALSSYWAKAKFIGEAKTRMEPNFKQSVFMLENDGLDERRIELPREIRNKNIENAKKSMGNIETLFEIKGMDRLKKFFGV